MRQCSRAENSKDISKSTKPREIIATVRKQKTELNNQLQPVHLWREGIPPYGIYHFKPKRRKKNYRREDIFGFNTKFFKLKYKEKWDWQCGNWYFILNVQRLNNSARPDGVCVSLVFFWPQRVNVTPLRKF